MSPRLTLVDLILMRLASLSAIGILITIALAALGDSRDPLPTKTETAPALGEINLPSRLNLKDLDNQSRSCQVWTNGLLAENSGCSLWENENENSGNFYPLKEELSVGK